MRNDIDPLASSTDMATHGGDPGERTGLEVAVVGMAGRFPGAADIHAFWRNLRDGVESISFFTREELLDDGVDRAVLDHPGYVPARGHLSAADEIDAELFGLTPRDAEVLDPQHRVLLECAWSALEHAGYDPARVDGPIGVFAGSGTSSYGRQVESSAAVVAAVGALRVSLWNEKDQLAAGISYRLNLRGPALAVQTACSTSLVAVHLACQSLINGECDLALAGGVSIHVPLRRGYVYTPDGIVSPDGHCRAFDAGAAGTVGGNGAGLVALKRLEQALADGDTIHAVIRGSAINNDGAQKVGYTAPSVVGQAAVLSEALSVAAVDPGTLQYVEAHGTGTPLGDAIELKALGEVLSRTGGGRRCAIGSVKTNIGHLDSAAGVAGLIKTVLALEHREIPPSLNCAVPHPEIEASGGYVFVNTELRPWDAGGTPRRAGVSSFGIGGTNAHAVLEEAPSAAPSGPARPFQLLVLSARTPAALSRAAEKLAAHLEHEAAPLADAAFTLQRGRRELEHRLAVVCADAGEGAARLRDAAGRDTPAIPGTERPVAFMFPGVGTQYVDMSRGLYDAEPAFREVVDACCELLLPVLGSDLREVLFSPREGGDDEAERGGGWNLRRLLRRGGGDDGEDAEGAGLDDTRFGQPAMFVVEYALARLWMSWGVRPRALIGHSLGEYVAACVAGVLRLEDALRLVALRARLIGALPAGAMLAVPLGESALREVLPAALEVAAVNTRESCVVAGPADEIGAFEAALAERGVVSRRLPARHAFHSRAMEHAADGLERLLAEVELRAPEIPFVSNVTGTWITDAEARSPAYWSRHLCRTVRFADGVAALRREPGWVLLEVGPGQTLGAWAMQHPSPSSAERPVVLSSLRHQHNRVPDLRFALETLGGLWAAGVEVDWKAFSAGERRHRVPLPGYPFERKRYLVDPPRPAPAEPARSGSAAADEDGDGVTASREKGVDVIDNQPAVPEPGAAPSPRRQAILHRLRALTTEMTGIEERYVDTGTDFFQAGFDSLLLLQAVQSIEKQFGVRLALVELLEEITTLGALAAHLDRALPPEVVLDGAPVPAAEEAPAPVSMGSAAFADAAAASAGAPLPEPPPAVYAPPAPHPAPGVPVVPAAEGSALERLIAQQHQLLAGQLQLMEQQLAAVRGHAAPPLAAAPAGNGSHAPVPAAAGNGASHSGNGVHVPPGGAPAPRETVVPASPRAFAAGGTGAAPAAPEGVPQPPRSRIRPETFVAYQPLNTEGPAGMTARQKEYLDGFMARYVERTRGSKAHQARYHQPLADTRVTARFRRAWKEILYPIAGERAAGSRIWDPDGNEYVDIGMAFGCALFGHAPDFVTRALQEQIGRGYGLGPQSLLAGRAAELVCELGGNERAVFCNSGTEAVMGAIRAARAFTGRSKIAYFAGSYHGWSDAVLGRQFVAGGRREVRPSAPGVPALPLGDVLMLDFDDPSSLELLAEHVADVALVLVEPVQSRRPDLQPFAFLRELRRMTRDAGALLLFDELITGFRMGAGGAQAFFGVDADLVTYGKIVAGGLAMGVVAGTSEVMSVFDGGMWSYGDDSYPTAQRTLFAGAYFKHPLSMGVACAVLEEIRRRGPAMYQALDERTTRLVERINAFFERGGYPVTAAHFSSCFRFFFGPEVKFPDLFNHHLIHEGVYVIPETGTYFLSTAHTDEDLETVFQAVRASAEAMRRGGFIPGPAGGGDGRTAGADGPAAARPSSSPPTVPSANGTHGGDEPDGILRLPLTEGQRQLWIESQMGEDANRAYIESTSVRLRGALDVEALRRALQALVDRHDTLRVTFDADGETQLVHPSLAVALPVADFRAATPDAREERLRAWVDETVRRAFDLRRGPLVRFALAALADDEHVLLFDSHHAVLDGWSFGVLWTELNALYAAEREGRAAELAPPPDYAAMVRAQTGAAGEDAAARVYWRERFADGVPLLDLPADRPRPAARSYHGERVVRAVEGAVVDRLAAVGQRYRFTLFNIVLSAFYAWLARLSGEDEIVVGTPAAGQAAGQGASALVGYGVNILPIRVRVDPRAPFAEHARRVRQSVLGALQHQRFSFAGLVETLLRTRDASRPPVFSVLLNLDRARDAAFLGDLRAEFDTEFGGGSKVDLTFDVVETERELRVRCIYATDLFDRGTIERWLACFERILAEVARDPEVRIAELPLIGDEDHRRVVEEWNRTERPYPHVCIHQLFEAQVDRTPDAVAVVCGESAITYAELDARANRIAHHLRGRGAGPEDRVALCMERGLDLMAAFFGILKAGAAYVPLDPTHPAERLGYMLRDSRARLLLTQSWLQSRLPADCPGTLLVDAMGEALAREPATRPESGVRPENLAYVYYTSGSTGRPKGVAMHHYGPANYFDWGRTAYGAAAGRGAPVFSSMAVDLTLANFIPLFAGERVELLPEGPGVEALAEAIRRAPGFSMIKITPTHLALLNQVLAPGDLAGSTATLVVGADNLPAEPVRPWQQHAPRVRLLNEYGPTETVVGCSLYEIPAGVPPGGRVPIGRPIHNLAMYVLDARMRPAPVGVPGELYIGGVGVARGYLDRPALTAEKFVPDPFASTAGARLYRTGDRSRFLPDGNLEFLGRLDFQVKIRGHRIETGEIESVLRAHPRVRDALVMAREDVPGDRRLAAYVIPAEPAPGVAELRDALRERLPEYMLPADFVFLECLPAGSTGKVDRRALPAPEHAAAGERRQPPRTPVEETLAEIWAAVLRVERVGADDDFFRLGGHSLLAMRVASRAGAAFGIELPLRAVFEAPTVAALATRVDALRRADAPRLPPPARADRSRPLPLSPAQERLWFFDRMQPRSAVYNIALGVRLRGALDPVAMERALGEIVRRHEALRTVFREADGEPVQVVRPFAGFVLPVEALPDGDEAALRRRDAAEAARPFDLSAGPLFRARLLRMTDDDHALLLGVHHAVADGWSMDVLFRELAVLYEAYRRGGESPLPELALQYGDYAAWQREHLRGEALERQLDWWSERLAGAPALLELPTDRPRPAEQTFRGSAERIELPGGLTRRLRTLAGEEGATLYMVLLGAFQVLLARYSGGDDVVVGTTTAGRARGETEPLIGLFMNTLALRTRLDGDPSFREVLRRVREVALSAFDHDVPFEQVVARLQPERSLSHSPLFQVLFELDAASGAGYALPGLEVREMEAESDVTKFDLALVLRETVRGVAGELAYSTDLFDPATVRRMREHLETLLEQVAADPGRPVSRLDLATAAERARLAEWNRTAAEYPAELCVHQLFEAQTRRAPGAPALVSEGGSLSYGELDARANRLAHHLAGLGVGPEVRVGLCLERGVELMVCILGVMKAGGAWVPLDPAHPAERNGYVLADSAVTVVLTQERLRGTFPVRDGVRVLAVDAEWERIAAEDGGALRTGVTPENLAYVIYTSGSTGRPKGVAMHHRGVVNYIHWGIGFYGAGRGGGSPVFSSMAVDLTLTNLLPLFAGGPVHLLPEENAVEALAAALRGSPGFGAIKITPVHLSLLTPLLTPEEARAAAHTLVIGADFLFAEPTVFWQDHAPGVRLMNEYGPTETVVGCSAYLLPPGAHRSGPVPVGRPIQNLSFHLLDAHLHPVPVGLPGELYIGGAGVARGYLGRPGLSAEKFVPDPFAGGGARMYRTGDRARWLEDGNLVVLGRTDAQVKVRGYRVEPGEIEAVLRRHPSVSAALVVVREDVPGDRRLVAYVAGGADAGELRAHLRQSVPEHMVPSAFVLLDRLPETATGKIDPRTLPAPELAPAEDRWQEPGTPLEQVLAEIWAEVLGVERVGLEGDFFELGGHSLLAMRLIGRVRAAFGLELPIRALFSLKTLGAVADEIERMAYEKIASLPEAEAEALAAHAAAGEG